MEGHPVIEKLDKLLSVFQDPAYVDDLEKIRSMKADTLDLLNREELCQNETLKETIKKFSGEVENINKRLLVEGSETLSTAERDRLIDKKNLYINFISYFDVEKLRKEIETVDKEVDAELEHVNSVL